MYFLHTGYERSSLLHYHAPRLYQFLQRPGRVGRRGGWQADILYSRLRQAVPAVNAVRLFSIGKDVLYFCCAQDFRKIIGHGVFYGRIAGSHNVAGMNGIPQSHPVSFQQGGLLFNRGRNRLIKKSGHHLPETVLGMSVKEHALSGFYGREAAEDQYSGILSVKCRNWMYDMSVSVVVHRLSFSEFSFRSNYICPGNTGQYCIAGPACTALPPADT